MSAIADGYPFKVTLPAPSLFGHPFSYKPGVPSGYGSLEEFVAHAIQIERGLVADAIKAGGRYVQFDVPLSEVVCGLWGQRSPGGGEDGGLERGAAEGGGQRGADRSVSPNRGRELGSSGGRTRVTHNGHCLDEQFEKEEAEA